jgi:predicted naringenin-chalcone synthase
VGEHSFAVLQNHGNMSSPTVLFVLSKLIEALQTKPSAQAKQIYTAAFGPGLSVESALLSVWQD